MKKYLLLSLLLCLMSIPAFVANAANTTGYAWSESLGWFDFSNITVGDSTVTGYAYNDNTGWLVLDGITNVGGTLSGYAWSESVGYFNFSNVTISNGVFKGYAYNDNTGWLSFEPPVSVTTTWTLVTPSPTVAPVGVSFGSGGSSIEGRIYNLRMMGFYKEAERLQAEYSHLATSTTTEISQSLLKTQYPKLIGLTMSKGSSSNTKNLQKGSKGEVVTQLQKFLIARGYIISPGATGYFGDKTKQALIKFQKDNKIKPAIGTFGPVTLEFIKNLGK